MDDKELKQILSTKAPAYQRSLIEIPKDSFVPHYSSLTDYLDRVVGYEEWLSGAMSSTLMPKQGQCSIKKRSSTISIHGTLSTTMLILMSSLVSTCILAGGLLSFKKKRLHCLVRWLIRK